MKYKEFAYAVVFLLQISISIAQAEDGLGEDKFQDENFLLTSDATQWPSDKVPWGNPAIYSNPSVYNREDTYSNTVAYTNREFYRNLPEDKYGKLNYKVVNFGLINDHSKINSDKYFKDFGCNCVLNKKNKNKLKFSEEGISHASGDFVLISTEYPAGTFFLAQEGRIEIILPPGTKSVPKKMLEGGSFTLNTGYAAEYEKKFLGTGNIKIGVIEMTPIPKTGATKLPDGSFLDGKLSYKGGQAYIKKSDEATIEGIEIKTAVLDYAKQDIMVFFDGERHPKADADYVSFDLAKKRMVIGADDKLTLKPSEEIGPLSIMNLRFNKGNPFLNVEKNDLALIMAGKNVEISIQNRENAKPEPLSPLVDVKQTAGASYSFIRSGDVAISAIDGKVSLEDNARTGGTSSQAEVIMKDQKGDSMLGTKEKPMKILISGYNEFAVTPLNAEEGLVKISGTPYSIKINSKLSDKHQALLQLSETGPTNIPVSGDFDKKDIKDISKLLGNLPPDIVDSFAGIRIHRDEDIIKEEGALIAYVTEKDRIMNLPKSGWDASAIYHEGAHELNYKLNEDYKMTKAQSKTGLGPSFQEEWKSIAGNVYGKGLGPITLKKDELSETWSDDTAGPRNGCVSAYGCNNLNEDIATSTREFYFNKQYNLHLINPANEDKRYVKKLALANNYKLNGKIYSFFPKGWLAGAMEEAGYSEECIKAVDKPGGYKAQCIN